MEELSVEKRNWSELPNHLLDIIMDKLSSPKFLSDYIRFGAVCDSWNSAFCDHDIPPSHQFPPILLLMVAPPPPIYTGDTLRIFYNISDEKIDGRLEVRRPPYRHCRGSSHGWLITVDDNYMDYAVRLFNPFLSTDGIEILLPSLKTFPTTRYDFYNYSFLRKAVLSANPLTNPTDYTVMAIYGSSSRLAFFKPGNKCWTSIRSPNIKGCKPGNFTDIIYCHIYGGGKFFVVNWDGAVVAVSDKGKGMIAKLVIQPPLLSSDKIYTKNYLIVDSSGRELLQVHRFLDISKDQAMYRKMTTGFRVFKLKVTGGAKEEEYKWQEVKSLCGDSMFLGHNTSISIRASDYPGCKLNCIHYTVPMILMLGSAGHNQSLT